MRHSEHRPRGLPATFWLLLLAGAWAATPLQAQTYDLTGCWDSDEGAVYRIRQIGDKVYWVLDHAPRVINVFHGVVAGNTITGHWADVPGGRIQGNGAIGLRIETNDRLVKDAASAPYRGTWWARGSCPPATAVAAGQPTGPPAEPGRATPTQRPATPTPQPAAPTPSPAARPAALPPGPPGSGLLGSCWTINPPQLSFKTSIYPDGSPPEYRYEMFLDGYSRRRAGRMTIRPDSSFTLEDTSATNNDLCTWTGRIFVLEAKTREIVEGGVSCESGWSAGADWRWESNPVDCSGPPKNMRVADAPPAPLADLRMADTGRVWVVRGPDRWLGRWIRRGDSDVYDGVWRRGAEGVTTVVRLTRAGQDVTATRTASSDGVSCTYRGAITGTEVQGTQSCTQQGQTYGPFPFTATIVP